MSIQVLGSGCATCKKLYEITQKAVENLGISEQVEYISGPDAMKKIIELGSLSSPILVIQNKIVMTGFTANIQLIQEKIQSALQK